MRCDFPAVVIGAVLLLSVGSPLHSAEEGFGGRMIEVRELHDAGAEGDKEAVVECIALLQGILKKEPDNQLARVYLGSAMTLRSRDLAPGPGKLEALVEGGELMDAAVNADSTNARVRLVRAINNLKLPAIFGRRERAYDDFAFLLRQVRSDKHNLNVPEQQAIYFFGGEALRMQRQKEAAVKAWQTGIALDDQSDLAKQMRAALKKAE